MSTYLALVAQQVLVTTQAEPIRLGDSGVFSVVFGLNQMSSETIDFLLKVDQVLLNIFGISLFSQEDIEFIDFLPNVSDLLVHTVGCVLLLLKISDQANQVGSLVMQLIIKVSLEILYGLSINHLFLWSRFSLLSFCLLSLSSLFLFLGIHGLVEFHIFSQILKTFFNLLDPSNRNIMLSISLSVVLLDDIWSWANKFSQSVYVKVLIDKHVVNLLNFLLILIHQFLMLPLLLLQFISGLGLESWELGLSNEGLKWVLYFW